ncbi:hypothetical protein BVRB_016900, partial [Beta vulgaris subsp. vulgaris]
SKGVD